MKDKFIGKNGLKISVEALKTYIDTFDARIKELETQLAAAIEQLADLDPSTKTSITIPDGVALLYGGVKYTGSMPIDENFDASALKIVILDDTTTKIYTFNTSTLSVKVEDRIEEDLDVDITSGQASTTSGTSNFGYIWTDGTIEVTNAAPQNNIDKRQVSNGILRLYRGQSTATGGELGGLYTISTNMVNYVVKSISFDVVRGSANVEIDIAGQAVTATSTTTHVDVDNIYEASPTLLLNTSSNIYVDITNLKVTLVRVNDPDITVPDTTDVAVSPMSNSEGECFYRIPGLTSKDGLQLFVYDKRYDNISDIGNNHAISIVYKTRKDGVLSDEFTLVHHSFSDGNRLHTGFGDPAVIIDRETGKILCLSVAGNVSFSASTSSNHLGIARYYSDVSTYNNGELTWEDPTDISEQIYNQLSGLQSTFVASGRIHQSKYIKIGSYYRVYATILDKSTNVYLIYSDDFGETWSVNTTAALTGGDEAIANELANGDVIVSSRPASHNSDKGRVMNIFHFSTTPTTSRPMSGSWDTSASSPITVSGIANAGTSGFATRGDLLMVPVKNESGDEGLLALVSMPFGNGRIELGLKYKFISASNITTSELVKNWEGYYVVNAGDSAYSSLDITPEGKIAIFYEDIEWADAPTWSNMVYIEHSIEAITGNKYTYNG